MHSHRLWQPVRTKPEKGSLGLGAWIADAGLVKATPWVDFGFAGVGTIIDRTARSTRAEVQTCAPHPGGSVGHAGKRRGSHLAPKAEKVVKVNHTHFVHC